MDRRRQPVRKTALARRRPPSAHERTLDFDDLIYGIHAVERSAARRRDRFASIHVARDRTKDPGAAGTCSRRRESARCRCASSSARFFERVPFKAHQGVIAVGAAVRIRVAARRSGAARARQATPRLVVVLDHLTDPHNVGAIIRTAEAAGADGARAARPPLGRHQCHGPQSRGRGCRPPPPIARVANIADAIRTLKKAGIWVAGADPRRSGRGADGRPTLTAIWRSSSGPRERGSRRSSGASAITW